MELTTEQQELLRRAIRVFGEPGQWAQVIEECAELIVAIKHRDRERATVDQVAEEVADVLIMAQQARKMIGSERVDRIMKAKLERLERRIVHEEGRRQAGLDPKGDTGVVS